MQRQSTRAQTSRHNRACDRGHVFITATVQNLGHLRYWSRFHTIKSFRLELMDYYEYVTVAFDGKKLTWDVVRGWRDFLCVLWMLSLDFLCFKLNSTSKTERNQNILIAFKICQCHSGILTVTGFKCVLIYCSHDLFCLTKKSKLFLNFHLNRSKPNY